MDGTALAGGLSAAALAAAPHAGLSVELATRADEPELRRLLRENPMDGAIQVTLEREPDAFLAAAVEGDPHAAVVARDPLSGRVAGMGSRAVMDVFVNGRPARVGYLSQLRLDRPHRGRRRLLARGYELLARQRRPGEEPFDLTSIVEDNRRALRLLRAGVPGLPTYRPLESFVTLVIAGTRLGRFRPARDVRIEAGGPRHLEAVAACLERFGRRHQLGRRWSVADLTSRERCRGLRLEDFRLALRGGEIVGCAALWDQSAFKQVVVRGYSRALARWRPLLNRFAWLLRTPRLPEPGRALLHAYVSHVAVDGDDPAVFDALLLELLDQARRQRRAYVVAGFAARHALLAATRRRVRAREYESLLHLVHGEEGAAAAQAVDGRVPHVEVALL